jgi:hypothetical protein
LPYQNGYLPYCLNSLPHSDSRIFLTLGLP